MSGDLPDGPVVKTPSSQCRGHRFGPWSDSYDPAHALLGEAKKKSLKILMSGFIPRCSDLAHPQCNLAVGIFKSSLGNSNVR